MRFNGWQQILKGGAKGLIHPPPIAIDFGAGSLKILQVGPGDPPTLVAAAALPTPDELLGDPTKRLTFQLEALPEVLKACEFRGKRAVCALPAAQTFCKHMQFQQEPGVALSALIASAIPVQLKCDPNALVFRHVEVGPVARSNKTEVICMAAARDMVERFMSAMKIGKLEPVGMHSEFLAALRAFDSITRAGKDDTLTSLYVDIGAGVSKVAMAHGRQLVFARTINLGGRHLDAAVARQLKLSLDQARAKRLELTDLTPASAAAPSPAPSPAPESRLTGRLAFLGVAGVRRSATSTATLGQRSGAANSAGRSAPPPKPGGIDLSEPLEILTDEISMCLRYHDSIFPDRRVDRAIFFGGEARQVALCQHIAKVLKLPAQVADPMARVVRIGHEPVIGVDLAQSQPGWTVALGLCLCPTDL
jgi:type IV pilus assembly protein PilM